jgi:iron(II)-dependent oxidoreductase
VELANIDTPVTDAARLRNAGRDVLSLALIDARNHLLRVFAVCEEALAVSDMAVPRMPEIDPPLWALGHVGWFQEFWIARNVQRQRGERCDPSAPKLASIEPHADRWYDPSNVPHETRWQLDLPALAATKLYLLETLDTTLDLLGNTNDGKPDIDEALYFYRLSLFHEDMHSEALATMAQTLDIGGKAMVALVPQPTPRVACDPLLFPATQWRLGLSGGDAQPGFAFDNEKAAHEVAVPEFEIDALPVSWSQYAEFVEDGGYDEAHWWHPSGWDWLQRSGRRTPRHVEQMRQGVLARRFGQLMRLPMAQPAMHVSWYEADAWCRWAGRRCRRKWSGTSPPRKVRRAASSGATSGNGRPAASGRIRASVWDRTATTRHRRSTPTRRCAAARSQRVRA